MHSSAAARQRLTAWFALLAMWLVVCLPPVSQVLASRQAREPVAELCSGSTASAGQLEQAGHHATTIAKCGYCNLLGTHPLLSSVTATAPSWLPPAQQVLAAAAFDALVPIFACRTGHPRDPPLHA
ncbi:DUF2946 domain-containing protein [Paraburkholderia caffeinitolerans]|nr:DUF2946 domain-containing protein [Paraburkholderia caffeinitolerans]